MQRLHHEVALAMACMGWARPSSPLPRPSSSSIIPSSCRAYFYSWVSFVFFLKARARDNHGLHSPAGMFCLIGDIISLVWSSGLLARVLIAESLHRKKWFFYNGGE
jgi:hypothetical protein